MAGEERQIKIEDINLDALSEEQIRSVFSQFIDADCMRTVLRSALRSALNSPPRSRPGE